MWEKQGEKSSGLDYIKTESWMKHYLYGGVKARTGTGALAAAKKNILSSELVVFIQTLVFFQLKARSPAQRAG